MQPVRLASRSLISVSYTHLDYSTFEEAWKYAVNYEKTFKLLSDWMVSGGDFGANESNKAIFFTGGALSVPSNHSVTIDLNGYKISRDKGENNMTDDGSVIRLFDGASTVSYTHLRSSRTN